MTSEMTGATALARLHDLGYTLPPVGPDDPKYSAHQRLDSSLAVLNALAVATAVVGELDRVRVVQMLVFVASTIGFGDQSKVADGASELLLTVLGDHGGHARTAIGVVGLPGNSPVEIQMVCADAAPVAG